MSEQNQFKKLFEQKDFEAANRNGREFIEILKASVPDIMVEENESQARTDVFEGSPGFSDGCDIEAKVGDIKLCFEITGDLRYLEKNSKVLLFNEFSVNKLLSHDGHGFSVYYLAKENPTKFFVLSAAMVQDGYVASHTKKTVRGDTGIKYKIPIGDWMPMDVFVKRLNSTLKNKARHHAY